MPEKPKLGRSFDIIGITSLEMGRSPCASPELELGPSKCVLGATPEQAQDQRLATSLSLQLVLALV